jgi:hypothetical protein
MRTDPPLTGERTGERAQKALQIADSKRSRKPSLAQARPARRVAPLARPLRAAVALRRAGIAARRVERSSHVPRAGSSGQRIPRASRRIIRLRPRAVRKLLAPTLPPSPELARSRDSTGTARPRKSGVSSHVPPKDSCGLPHAADPENAPSGIRTRATTLKGCADGATSFRAKARKASWLLGSRDIRAA